LLEPPKKTPSSVKAKINNVLRINSHNRGGTAATWENLTTDDAPTTPKIYINLSNYAGTFNGKDLATDTKNLHYLVKAGIPWLDNFDYMYGVRATSKAAITGLADWVEIATAVDDAIGNMTDAEIIRRLAANDRNTIVKQRWYGTIDKEIKTGSPFKTLFTTADTVAPITDFAQFKHLRKMIDKPVNDTIRDFSQRGFIDVKDQVLDTYPMLKYIPHTNLTVKDAVEYIITIDKETK
jgi:hypothetical protein